MKLYFFTEAWIPRHGGNYYLPDVYSGVVHSCYLNEFESIALVRPSDETQDAVLKQPADTGIEIVALPRMELHIITVSAA